MIVGTGDERKSFALHKSLVCKRSEYFRASLGGDWKESHTGQIELSEDDPKVFALYIQSLYVGYRVTVNIVRVNKLTFPI